MSRGKAWSDRLAEKTLLQAGQKVVRATPEGMFSLSLDAAGEVVATLMPPRDDGVRSISFDEWFRHWYDGRDELETSPLFSDRKRPETTGLDAGKMSKIKGV